MSDKLVADRRASASVSLQPSFLDRSGWVMPVLLGGAVLLAMLLSLCLGAYPLPFLKAAQIVGHLALPWALPDHPPWTVEELIVVQVIRLPRVLLATFAGLALGLAGAALQGMMRNPLVGPDLVGVSSGAAFGSVLAMLIGWSFFGMVGMAFGMGLLAMACTFGLAHLVRGGVQTMALILAGVFVGAFFTALVGIVQYVADNVALPGIVYWLLGSFVGADKGKVALIAIPVFVSGSILMLLRWRLNVLSLSDLDAQSLGVNVRRLRWLMIGLVSLLIAGQVAVSGIVGWIGLVVPHVARMLVGPDHRRVLPASALVGALLSLGLDNIARSVAQQEIPVGILSALFGTPMIAVLFWKTQGKGWNRE